MAFTHVAPLNHNSSSSLRTFFITTTLCSKLSFSSFIFRRLLIALLINDFCLNSPVLISTRSYSRGYFLTSRSVYKIVRGHHSSTTNVISGVPQSSLLNLQLCIFVNYLPLGITSSIRLLETIVLFNAS